MTPSGDKLITPILAQIAASSEGVAVAVIPGHVHCVIHSPRLFLPVDVVPAFVVRSPLRVVLKNAMALTTAE